MRGLRPFLRDAWHLAKPYFKSEERIAAWALLIAIVALNLLLVGMDVVLNFWNNAFYTALQNKQWDTFIDLLFFYRRQPGSFLPIMPGFCTVAALYIAVAVYRTYLNQWLQIRWRRWMTNQFLQEWLGHRTYYTLGLSQPADGSGTDNPDQRIAEDLKNFVQDTLILGLDLMSNIVSLFSFLGILWSLSGAVRVLGVTIPGYMVWAALIYAIAGTTLAHLIGRPLAALNFQQQRYEADFRFALVRVRENAEGIALYEGENEEQNTLRTRFGEVVLNWWGIMRRTKMLNALVNGYQQVAVIFPIVVAAPRYFSGAIQLGGLTQTSSAFGQVQSAMSWFVSSYSSLAAWRANVERLASFQRSMQALKTTQPGIATDFAGPLAVNDLTLHLPNGTPLLRNATHSFEPGTHTMISGRSGSGKSTLFRAFAGIWPFGTGRVQRPAGRTLFLPQRPYLPLGTLRHAVAYPEDSAHFTDDQLRTALQDAGLPQLVNALDEDSNWSQRLSGGEQQRLAMARALLLRPDTLFLDEATANLDPESESTLLAALRQTLPGSTVVAITHRPMPDQAAETLVVRDGHLTTH